MGSYCVRPLSCREVMGEGRGRILLAKTFGKVLWMPSKGWGVKAAWSGCVLWRVGSYSFCCELYWGIWSSREDMCRETSGS